jgi:hypothetical protein
LNLILLAATLAVFGQVCTFGFINFDDGTYVAHGTSQIQRGLNLPDVIWAFRTTHAANWHPLTWISYQVDGQLFGLEPWGYHLTNLLLHAANALLLFYVLRRLSGTLWRSFLVAALFAVHPLHVESVAWISERKDVLSTFFGILALGAYVRYTERPGWRRYLLVLLLFALSLLAKPMLVTLPCVLLLLDYWPLDRLQKVRQWAIWDKLPLFAFSAASCGLTWWVQQAGGAVQQFEHLPLEQRLGNAVVAYADYLGKTLWPVGLAVFYPHPQDTLTTGQVAAAGTLLAVLTGLVFWQARRRPYLLVGWLWYLGTLVPVIGLVQVGAQALADRYTYVPLLGLFLIFSWGLNEVVERWPRVKGLAVATAALLLVGCLGRTWQQTHTWRDSMPLWEHTLEVTSGNYLAHNNLGSILLDRGQTEEAARHLEAAVTLRPGFSKAHYNLGLAYLRLGRFGEAVPHFSAVLRMQDQDFEAHSHLGQALLRHGQLKGAEAQFRRALDLKRRDPLTYNQLGNALLGQARWPEALLCYQRAMQLAPDDALRRQLLQERLLSFPWSRMPW